MSLQLAAQHLANQGRGNDSMLVHMSPREVRGLQALAMAKGGALSINPQTGLPEAGFLEDLLPTLAGVALSFIPGVGPLAAAGIVGGATGIATGDIGKGLMAGLGAWGGAGLTNAIGQMGASALASNPEMVASQLGVEGAATGAGSQAAMLAAQNQGMGSAGLEAVRSAAGTASGVGTQAAMPTLANQISTGAAQQFMPSGSFSVTDAAKGAYNLAKDNPMMAGAAALPPVVGALQAPGVVVPPNYTEEEDSELKRISPNFRASTATPNYYTPSYPTYGASGGTVKGLAMGGQPSGPVERMSMGDMQPGMYPQGMMDKTYYATPSQRPASMEVVNSDYDTPVNSMTGMQPMRMNKGGPAHLGVKGVYSDSDPDTARKDAYEAAMIRLNKSRKAASLPGVKMPASTVKGLGDIPTIGAAQGGHLGGYSDGGRMLKGPGDGMSDDIPAMIGKKQPARLADGEFVVPADVVSHLGNGSTDAGARKLYKMMDNIRKARTGKKKQAPAVKADKYLPA